MNDQEELLQKLYMYVYGELTEEEKNEIAKEAAKRIEEDNGGRFYLEPTTE
jgi:hypothetical protein